MWSMRFIARDQLNKQPHPPTLVHQELSHTPFKKQKFAFPFHSSENKDKNLLLDGVIIPNHCVAKAMSQLI